MVIQIDDSDIERIASKVCAMLAGVVPAGSGKQVTALSWMLKSLRPS